MMGNVVQKFIERIRDDTLLHNKLHIAAALIYGPRYLLSFKRELRHLIIIGEAPSQSKMMLTYNKL